MNNFLALLNNKAYTGKSIIILGIITILPFIVISWFNHPTGDDFCFTFLSQSKGLWMTQYDYYMTWTGRYFSTFILSINPLTHGWFFLYKAIPVVLILALIWAINLLIKTVLPESSTYDRFTIGLAFLTMYFTLMPTIAEGFFWMAGSITYQLANICFVLFLVSFIHLIRTDKKWSLPLCVFLSFVIIGLNETSMILLDLFLVSFISIRMLHKKPVGGKLIILIWAAVLFSMIVFFSPGNAIRESYFTAGHQFQYTIISSLYLYKLFLLENLPLILIITVLIFDFINRKPGRTDIINLCNIHPLYSFLITFSIPFIVYSLGIWNIGINPPPRTENVLYFVFLLSFIHFVIVISRRLKQLALGIDHLPGILTYLLVATTVVMVIRSNNISMVYKDLYSGNAYNYNLQMEERYEVIRNCKTDTCVISGIDIVPGSFYLDELTNDPFNWNNNCFASYMNKPFITISNQ